MKFENPNSESYEENQEALKEKLFEEIYNEALGNDPGEFIEYRGEYPKHEFLDWVVKKKGILLHGSNNSEIEEMEPRQANCRSKKFGNRIGVYAVEDSVLPIFYSIKDKERFEGEAESGVSENSDKDQVRKEYHFAVTKDTLEKKPWSDGAIYLLPKDSFIQGTDDDGNLIDEWMSEIPVKPRAKIQTSTEDFPYMDEISPIYQS